ncbi:manganese efflux pump MntP family protein [Faecalicoccus sp.]|uniref:manganese efflux pump MntP n=1 Tax=Faecalicoccus sp. TaxID=1971758 RepID=UPI00261FC4F4|nr:manganese efflux pump MntP family protein [Faecalicoccus sp.]
MDTFTLLLTAVSLAMDASAVSLAKGMALPKKSLLQYAFILALAFGIFQGIMPCIGYFAGSQFSVFISKIDHWIAFVLLGIIGINMIKEGHEAKEECEILHSIPFKTVLLLAIATSIDALAVGVSFAFLQVPILWAALWIGVITFILSFCCVLIGKKVGSVFQKYAEYLGGCMLIFLGFKILIEHLFF